MIKNDIAFGAVMVAIFVTLVAAVIAETGRVPASGSAGIAIARGPATSASSPAIEHMFVAQAGCGCEASERARLVR